MTQFSYLCSTYLFQNKEIINEIHYLYNKEKKVFQNIEDKRVSLIIYLN